MIRLHRLRRHTALFALTLTIALAMLSGCAGKQTNGQSGKQRMPMIFRPMSTSAQANYDYLVYRDKLQQLRQDAQGANEEQLSLEASTQLHNETVAALDRVLAVEPSPQLYIEKASLYWNHPDGTGRARSILEQGLVEYPNDRLLTVYLVNAYLADDDLDKAITVMNDFIARHPDDIEALEQLGQMLMEAGKDAQALDILKKIPNDKRTPEALYAIGRVQGNLGMRKASIANLQKALDMDPGFTEAMVELAFQYELSKDYVAAENIYTTILEQNESFPEARLRLISLNLKLNNPARGLELTLEGPPTKNFIMDAVIMFIDNDFFAQGSTALDMLTTGGATPAEYYFYKAVIAEKGEDDPAKALDYLSQVDPKDRLYPHALRFKAQLLVGMGKKDEALAIASKGKELFPNAPIFYLLESSLLKEDKNYEGAEIALLQGLQFRENDPELTYELAMLYELLNRRPEGLALMEKVIRAHPDNANALNYVGYTLAEDGQELDRALVLVTKASSLDPENGYILDSVAWVHFKSNNLDKAWEYIRYAIDVVQKDPVIWEHYGDIAAAIGNTKEARKGYKAALKLNNPTPDAVKEKLNNL